MGEVHSENKEGAAPTYKRGFGFHPLYCTLDAGAQRSLFPSDDYRYWGHWTDNTLTPAESDRDIRAHAPLENNIARLKDSGARRFPITRLETNQAWLNLVAWADTPLRR